MRLVHFFFAACVVAGAGPLIGCGSSASVTPGGGNGFGDCRSDTDCPGGQICRAELCVNAPDPTVGNFPTRVRLDVSTDYPAITRPEDNPDFYTQNFGEVDADCGEGCGGPRRLGVTGGTLAVDLDEEGMTLRRSELRFQSVEVSRRTVATGLFVTDIAVILLPGERATYASKGADRVVARLSMDVELRLSLGQSENNTAPLFTAENPFIIEDAATDLILTTADEGKTISAELQAAVEADVPVFTIPFDANTQFAVSSAQLNLVASATHTD